MADPFPEITSADEFIRLRQSEDPAEANRSARAALPLPVWWDLVLERSVDDPHDSVRRLVAGHPRSPRPAVARLVDDPWPVVAQEARARPAEWPSAESSEPS